jgi:hypothetical protein
MEDTLTRAESAGATSAEWATFDLILGLTDDLLPVVSDTSVPISPDSKMKGLGKTPSRINGMQQAIGFANWTQYHATANDIHRWKKDPRYGICLQTRNVRALDIDVDDGNQVNQINAVIHRHLGELPLRTRPNAFKVLHLIDLPGEYYKRSFKTSHGLVEFLANGQQCIVAGTHTSGVRYEWPTTPSHIPTITPEQFEALWAELLSTFAVEPEEKSTAPIKQETLKNAISSDEVANHLIRHDWVRSTERDGRLHIRCPFEGEHTGDSSESATTYFPANTGGFARGHFDCRHAHCASRTDEEFKAGVGFNDLTFDDLTSVEYETPVTDVRRPERFTPVPAAAFSAGIAPSWLIKSLIPRAELVVMFGASGSGKSFMALDLAAAIASGTNWRGLRTKKGTVVYIAAEGAGGFRNRLKAYSMSFGVPLEDLDIHVIAAAPNFLNKQDALDLAAAIVHLNPILVVVDTWAQTTAGANENSGEDMGMALSHCRGIYRATKATVMLIHHSGKNAAAGARGWSGLRAAADAEMEILRADDDRVLSSTKQKDGEDGAEYGFRLNVVPLELDEDGDVITSCVVEETEATGMTSKKSMQLGEGERAIVRVAGELVGLDGLLPDVNTVLDAAISEIPFEHSSGKRDRRRDIVRRGYAKLVERSVLIEVEGRVQVAE